jgi:hypothetical protein
MGALYSLHLFVIPASEARRESFLKTKNDSGQAGMTVVK